MYLGNDKSSARPDWKKKKLKGRHFSSDAEVIAAAETWLDGQTSEFFWAPCKSYSLVAVACFLPGRAKDLSAPLYHLRLMVCLQIYIFFIISWQDSLRVILNRPDRPGVTPTGKGEMFLQLYRAYVRTASCSSQDETKTHPKSPTYLQ